MEDSLEELQKILQRWCDASGTKFNVTKTNLILIGSDEYCDELIRTRKLSPELDEIPPDIKIANDGEPTRLLGAFIGNNIDQPSIWAPTMEAVNKDLEKWRKVHLTIDGKHLVLGMVIGGRTQYRTSVQGMPKDLEDQLKKIMRKFLWGEDTTSAICLKTLYQPIEKGGKKLLNIKVRNEAIEIMKAK
ncbi:hypothetical protein H0H92_011704 [Tricholoma furcatifolium]|nr:hypothetical protein H0H92_011704 [Tricholoma furcatifolium]